jgi:hypothetical protein
MAPDWLPETHVFHLNGSVEVDRARHSVELRLRSPFLLETDLAAQRTASVEFNRALQFSVWRNVFVVVGLSFTCPTDRALLAVLHAVEDDLPVGCGWWLVVNRDRESTEQAGGLLAAALPRALVSYVATPFEEWVADGMSELGAASILEPVTPR